MATVAIQRIVTDHLALKASHRDRSVWVKLEADTTCDACGLPIFSGELALSFEAWNKLACRDCGEEKSLRARCLESFEHMCMPPGFRG